MHSLEHARTLRVHPHAQGCVRAAADGVHQEAARVLMFNNAHVAVIRRPVAAVLWGQPPQDACVPGSAAAPGHLLRPGLRHSPWSTVCAWRTRASSCRHIALRAAAPAAAAGQHRAASTPGASAGPQRCTPRIPEPHRTRSASRASERSSPHRLNIVALGPASSLFASDRAPSTPQSL